MTIVDHHGSASHYEYDLKERLTKVHRLGKVREEYVLDAGDHFTIR